MDSTEPSAGERIYKGGCHCGFFRYTVSLDLEDPKASKCNCSICLKLNLLVAVVDPTKFTIETPASLDDVADYVFGSKWMHHYFCNKCGVHCFGQGTFVLDGKDVAHAAVNLVTLDTDQGVDLRKFKVVYWNGKSNAWTAGSKDEPFEDGVY